MPEKIDWQWKTSRFSTQVKAIVEERLQEIDIPKILTALYDINWNCPDEPFMESSILVCVNKKLPKSLIHSRVFTLQFAMLNDSESFSISVLEYSVGENVDCDTVIVESAEIPMPKECMGK